MRFPAKAQAGVALLMAVMVVAMASTLTAGLMVTQNLSVHRAANLRSLDAAWWYLVGLEEWAGSILRRDGEDSDYDALTEVWAQRIDFLPVDEGVLAGQITDLNGRFNLNALGAAEPQQALEQFQRLLAAIPELRDQPVAELGTRIADWIDVDSNPRFPGGAEDDAYLSLDPPRRAANHPLVSVSELWLIEGMTAEIYNALVPHVAVWPWGTGGAPINVNTATPALLQSLAEDINPGDIEALIQIREQSPFESIEQFNSQEVLAGRNIQASIDVKSNLFRAEGAADIDGVRMQMVSILERGTDKRVRVLAHSLAPF